MLKNQLILFACAVCVLVECLTVAFCGPLFAASPSALYVLAGGFAVVAIDYVVHVISGLLPCQHNSYAIKRVTSSTYLAHTRCAYDRSFRSRLG
jgi:hypothetical protein